MAPLYLSKLECMCVQTVPLRPPSGHSLALRHYLIDPVNTSHLAVELRFTLNQDS